MWFSGLKMPSGAMSGSKSAEGSGLTVVFNDGRDVIHALSQFNARRVKQMIAAINLLIVLSLINNLVFGRGVWLSAAAMSVFALLWIARIFFDRERPSIGQFLFIWTIFASVTVITWLGDGLRDQVILGNVTVLVFAAMLSTPRHFLILYLAIVANAVALGLANEYHWVNFGLFPFDWSNVGDVLMLYSVTAVTIFMLATDMRQLLARYNSEYRKAKASENEIYRLANHDALTGLPNLFSAQKKYRDDQARTPNAPATLFLIGLDNFKAVNDSLGHVFGDLVLKTIADRLQKIAGEDCVVFRVAGDVFGVLTSRPSNSDEILATAERISGKVSEPLGAGHQYIMLTCSIGAAQGCGAEPDFEKLRREADIALYRAKSAGRNAFKLFDESMNSQAIASISMAAKLKTAIEKREFQIYLQPKVELDTGRIKGAEALLRWFPEGEPPVRPDDFIPVAENTGMIVEIGEWVIQQACMECKRIQALGLPDFSIAVNVSAVQFKRGNLEHVVLDALYVSGLGPQSLEIELTESMLLEDEYDIRGQISRLAAKGVKFSVDDFGKGYSNLGNLSRFEVSTLKIDQSFVFGMFDNPQSAALVEAIVRMAKALGLKIVAEGVETQRAANMLGLHGVDYAQGYFWSKPVDVDTFIAYAAPDGMAKANRA